MLALSSLMPEGLNSFMGIWILFSALVYGVYLWFNPSGVRTGLGRGFSDPVGSDFLVLIIWLLISYYLKSKNITFSF